MAQLPQVISVRRRRQAPAPSAGLVVHRSVQPAAPCRRSRALNAAGVGEGAFHKAIEALRAAPGLSDESVINIAKGYIGDPLLLADREAAIGAIETKFHEERRAIHQAQTKSVKR
ncbi:MAG TPA: hypothetical protein VKA94_03110 [Hyphomicrobiales bacterium]|nr:hypothetical protein [Hyphomicrobiales bacterium]